MHETRQPIVYQNYSVSDTPAAATTCTCSKTKPLMDTVPPTDVPYPSQQDTASVNVPPPLI